MRIKSKEEIEATLDTTGRNRGLSFDGEMSNYCGRTARVRARVNRLIEESNGEMIDIKSDCIILEGIVCAGDYHRFCTRAIYPVLARDLAREGRRVPAQRIQYALHRLLGQPCGAQPDAIGRGRSPIVSAAGAEEPEARPATDGLLTAS